MLLPLPQRRRDTEENILPLINIVFLLLIFFMVAGALHTRAPFEVEPPGTEHADGSNPDNHVLAISADGELALGGDTLERAALTARLREREGDTLLQVKADSGLPAAELTELLSDIRAAGIPRIRLLTVHRGE
ncbi:biopolymer transporter ExbD [Salinisphaera sp. P385]|uniref:Biopolymer transporter ExbD n=1 Tax=Spectribacter acetivorans TaxID=3075603 RepID=A0ABU3B4M6_9GAMM|nr:biopolymer transporter ExbD [Salinisphaera sp. P385]MDT0617118.1 biopolymer transporter ExbD [Salinisphaera sp. P385]